MLGGLPIALGASQQLPANFDVKGIDAFLAQQVKEREIPGMSVALVREGRVVLVKGYGKSSLARNTPVTPETKFAIGSVTKQFTCACVLLLAEEGKLSVEDKVAKYFPHLTKANEITLLDLMNHVSGYPDYYPLDFVDRRMAKPISADQLLQDYAGGRLDFEPRTRWSYSNTGYVILGLVVEKVSGESFAEFLQRRILKPLGMENTTYEPEAILDRFAQGYTSFALGPAERALPEGKGWVAAAGALWSTPTDLAKWDMALMDGKTLNPDSYKLMTKARTLANGRGTGYGCGVAISLRNGVTVLTHSGMVSGFSAYNSIIPATRSAAVLLSNSEFLISPLHSRILSLMTKSEEALPKITRLSAADAARDFFARLQQGKVDRQQLGEEFSELLSAARLRDTASRLRRFGRPTKVDVESLWERGGMEVADVRIAFKSGQAVKALMYRTPDGKIQEFLVLKE